MANSEPVAKAPPAWLGVTVADWIAALSRHRFPVSANRLSRFLLPTLVAPLNSVAAAVQTLRFGRRIEAVDIDQPPLFIVGFLRTGTTLLHELLASDPRHTAPTMYQCMTPKHFLVTESFVRPLAERRLPRRRPMDDMVQGLDRPFEDEFALCLSGQDSPYMFFFFPGRAGAGTATPRPAGGDARGRDRWKADFVRFLKSVLLTRPGRLVLKSPPHTARIGTILEVFPEARFVHLLRNPLSVIPSAIHTVRVLVDAYGLQRAALPKIEEWVFDNFVRMHRSLEEDRRRLAPGRYLEVRYDDLVSDPTAELEKVYSALGLGEFGPARSPVERYLSGISGYRRNRFDLDASLRRRILDQCGWVMRRDGYEIA